MKAEPIKKRRGGQPGHRGQTVVATNKRVAAQRKGWQDSIQLERVMQRMIDAFEGRLTLDNSQIKAGETILDRLIPRLQSVEKKQINELDTLSRADILVRIRDLLASDPSLLPELIALNARESVSPSDVPRGTLDKDVA